MAEHPSPYRDIHSNLSSMFSVQQPVDTQIESIRNHVQKNIPNALDTVLFLNNGSQTDIASNAAGGAVSLAPLLTENRLAANPNTLRDYHKYESILLGLTDHMYFPLSHIRVPIVGGKIGEFSLVCVNPTSKENESYELHGSLTNPALMGDMEKDEFYLIETPKEAKVGPLAPIELDADIAQAIVNAACMQHGRDDTPASISEKLLYLVEESATKTIRKSGEYSIQNGETLLQADRSEIITRKLGKTASRLMAYSVRIQRDTQQPGEPVGITTALTLGYDATARPRYNAYYDFVVNDPHNTMERPARTSLFEERFMLYRARPELFFDEIAESLDSAASLQ